MRCRRLSSSLIASVAAVATVFAFAPLSVASAAAPVWSTRTAPGRWVKLADTSSLSGIAPDAFTNGAQVTGEATATLEGSVNPEGQTTTYYAQYDTIGSEFCNSEGTTTDETTLSTPTPPGSTIGSDIASHNVSVDLTGLTAGTGYCTQIVAVNPSGSTLGSIVTFLAGLPTAITGGAQATGATTAIVEGTINPSGQTTTYYAQYDTIGSTFCNSEGATTDGTTIVTPAPPGIALGSDTTSHPVSVGLTGLAPGTGYCAQIVAANSSGTTPGGTQSFTAGLPTVLTSAIKATGATTAMVEGTINPSGRATTYYAQYDTIGSEFCNSAGATTDGTTIVTPAPPGIALGSDTTSHPVSVGLTGLAPGTGYCAQIVAANSSGTTPGGTQSFTAGLPTVLTSAIKVTGATTAAVEGTINPSGRATTYYAQYDTIGSTFCDSAGATTDGTTIVTPAPPGIALGSDTTSHPVSVNLTGLTAQTGYCAQIVAVSSSGTTFGFTIIFTAGVPTVLTGGVKATGPTTATVEGTVNPSGQTTTYYAQYDTIGSTFCNGEGATADSTTSSTPAPPGTPAGSDTIDHAVSVSLTGLAPGTGYCAVIVVTNPSGTTSGGSQTFTTAVAAPSELDAAATEVEATSVKLGGEVNPGGGEATSYFEYGTGACGASTCGAKTEPEAGPLTGHTKQAVRPAAVTGLKPNTTYHFWIVAKNAAAPEGVHGAALEFEDTGERRRSHAGRSSGHQPPARRRSGREEARRRSRHQAP